MWQEQSSQWDERKFEPDKSRSAYMPSFSTGSLERAQERGKSDAAAHAKAKQKLKENKDPKNRRNLMKQGKKLMEESMRLAGQSAKLVGDASLKTGKVALQADKRAFRAGIGVPTLDSKMVKEAFTFTHDKVEKTFEIVRRSSCSKEFRSLGSSTFSMGAVGESETRLEVVKKPENLKFLGVAPIPGTKLMYNEDPEKKKM